MSMEESHAGHESVIDHSAKGLRYCLECKVLFFQNIRLTHRQVQGRNYTRPVVHSKLSKKVVAALVFCSCIAGVAAAILIDMLVYTKP